MFRASCAHHQEYKILTRQPPVQVVMVAGGSSLRHIRDETTVEKVCRNKSASCCITSVFYLTLYYDARKHKIKKIRNSHYFWYYAYLTHKSINNGIGQTTNTDSRRCGPSCSSNQKCAANTSAIWGAPYMHPVLSDSARWSHAVRSPAYQNVSFLRSLRNTWTVHVGPYTVWQGLI